MDRFLTILAWGWIAFAGIVLFSYVVKKEAGIDDPGETTRFVAALVAVILYAAALAKVFP